jgi:hypothetical protein
VTHANATMKRRCVVVWSWGKTKRQEMPPHLDRVRGVLRPERITRRPRHHVHKPHGSRRAFGAPPYFFIFFSYRLRLAQLGRPCPKNRQTRLRARYLAETNISPHSPSGTTPRCHSSTRAPVATQRPRTGLSDQPTSPLASSYRYFPCEPAWCQLGARTVSASFVHFR